MSQAQKKQHTVFVGNLTYHTNEEQLREIFSTVGPVSSVKIVVDKETGRPKGFAFIQYDDPSLALSAIRNLDRYELHSRQVYEMNESC